MKIDLIKLNEEIALGNVNKQVHPSLPIFIYKYSQQCVFSRTWNETTLLCRGLVLDEQGNIVINCMPKFFNHSESDGIQGYENRKNSDMSYVITDKMDGSLIQATKRNDKLIVTSSGSFTSPQAMKAYDWLTMDGTEIFPFIKEGFTYIFEIIYPQNRIVLNYGDKESLTLLAIRDTDTGHESSVAGAEFTKEVMEKWKIETLKPVDKTLEEIELEAKQDTFINKEGYVVHFADGYRVKVKFDEYMRLHKIVSGINEKYIWECLRDGVDIETQLVNVPDELFEFVKKAKAKFQSEFKKIEYMAVSLNQSVSVFNSRKEQAAWLLKHYKTEAPIVFCMLDGKNYSSKIWNMIEPEFKPGLMGMGESLTNSK